jgi:hypothetical protein
MAWQIVSLDFIEGLPKSGQFNCILVVVDKFSRYAHFIGLQHPFTAQTVAQAYMDNVYKLHSLPESIISDRDKVFTSKFWTELFRRSDTQLRMSSSYHPQTDGQTERVNQCLEAYLRCFSHACPESGQNGYPWRSIGIIPVCIRPWANLLSRSCMEELLGSLGLLSMMLAQLLIWMLGYLNAT